MTPEIQAAIEKIRKLAATADPTNNATENEISVAAAHIKRLLAKHNLSAEDVRIKSGAAKAAISEEASTPVSSYGKWDTYLHHVVDSLCGVKHFYSRSQTKNGWGWRVIFVGSPTDAALAAELYKILKTAVFSLNGRFLKEARAKGQHASRNSHMLGITSVMLERAQEQAAMDTPKEQETYGALMVVKGKEIREYLDSKNLRTARTQQTRIHGDSYRRGQQDGAKIDLGARNRLK